MAFVGLAGQLVSRIDEVVDAAFPQVRIGDLGDAMRNPVHDQRLGPAVPKRTVDRVVLRIDQIQVRRWRRRSDCDLQGRCGAQRTFAGRQFEDVLAGRGEGGGCHRCAGVLEGNRTGAGLLAPRQHGCGPFTGQGLDRSVQIGLAPGDHHTIDTGLDDRRKIGRFARVVDLPFQDAGRIGLVGIDFKPESGGADLVEGRRVVLASLHSQTGRIAHRDELVAVPVQQPTGLGQAHPAVIVPPVHVDLARADRLTPIVLHPLRAHAVPVAIRPTASVTRALRIVLIVQRGQCGISGDVGTGRLRDDREIQVRISRALLCENGADRPEDHHDQ